MVRSAAERDEAEALKAEAMANTDGPVLSPEQALILLALVARQGFIAQNDLGIAVDAADRAALEHEALLTTEKREQNALWLRLTDKGWGWAEENLNKAVPPHQSVLHHLLLRIAAHLESTGETLRDFIGEPETDALAPELAD